MSQETIHPKKDRRITLFFAGKLDSFPTWMRGRPGTTRKMELVEVGAAHSKATIAPLIETTHRRL